MGEGEEKSWVGRGGLRAAGGGSTRAADLASGGAAEGRFEIVPAVDLRGGVVVRLTQGDDRRRTVYGARPEAVVAGFAEAGATRVHVVDLDAAFGEAPQRELLARLLVLPDRPALQLGGGLRDVEAVAWALEAGFERAVVGSLAARDPEGFAALTAAHPGRIVPALDAAAGEVRVDGWRRSAGPLETAAARLRGLPCPAVLVTAIERDGTLEGADAALAFAVARASGLPALVSGGVATLADLAALLAAARSEPAALAGVVVGRALYSGAFTLRQALDVALGQDPPPSPLPTQPSSSSTLRRAR